MPELFSTDDIARRDRFGFWREAVCDSYVQLECDSQSPEQFSGEILLHRLSRISASFVSGTQQRVRRRKRDIARSTEASFLISLQLKNTSVIEQTNARADLMPGDFALYSSIDPYTLHLPDGFRQLVIQVPREEMLKRLPNADMLTGAKVSGDSEMGALVRESITRLVLSIDQSNSLMLHYMQDTIVDLIATGLASLDGAACDLSLPERQIWLRSRAYLQANLTNADLNRTMLATAMGLSVRRLGEVFQSEGTSIAATIREMRLQRIAADLRDPRFSRCSISEIAIRWGVNNLQHFSRMFRGHFNMSPSDYRQIGLLPGLI